MNETVRIVTITPTKADAEKGRWLLDSGDFYLPEGFTVAQSALVGFKPGAWAAKSPACQKSPRQSGEFVA